MLDKLSRAIEALCLAAADPDRWPHALRPLEEGAVTHL
jgi:hypothetical protein